MAEHELASLTVKDVNLSELWEMLKDTEAWCAAVHGFAKRWT